MLRRPLGRRLTPLQLLRLLYTGEQPSPLRVLLWVDFVLGIVDTFFVMGIVETFLKMFPLGVPVGIDAFFGGLNNLPPLEFYCG